MTAMILLAVVVASGLLFMVLGIAGGKEIVLGATTFAAGFLAGKRHK